MRLRMVSLVGSPTAALVRRVELVHAGGVAVLVGGDAADDEAQLPYPLRMVVGGVDADLSALGLAHQVASFHATAASMKSNRCFENASML